MSFPMIVGSNMYNEVNQAEEWLTNVRNFADGIFIVDNGSTDGTIEYFESQNVQVIKSNIILDEGYGPARNHLRSTALELFPNAHWLFFMDADERISPKDFHWLRFLKDSLSEKYNCIALPRLDWHDLEMKKANNDIYINPDWQARITRLNSSVSYVRRLHEQLVNGVIYAKVSNPVLNHFHRCAGQDKRDQVGKVCAYLHDKDKEWGHTYPKHHKEDFYKKQLEMEGLK